MAADTYNKLMEMDGDELYKWFNDLSSWEFMEILMKIRKEQDRDTRHACAKAVNNLPTMTHGMLTLDEQIEVVSQDVAYAACMNVNAL